MPTEPGPDELRFFTADDSQPPQIDYDNYEASASSFGLIKIGVNLPIPYDAIFGPFVPRVSPPGHTEVTPKSPEWLRARDVFEKQYEALVKLGEEQGFLEHVECYECSGELQITTNTEDREWVYDEPE